jgi:hypothetical protein
MLHDTIFIDLQTSLSMHKGNFILRSILYNIRWKWIKMSIDRCGRFEPVINREDKN